MQSGPPPPLSALRGHHRRAQSDCGLAFRFQSDDNKESRTVGMGAGFDEIGASEDELFSSFMDMDKIEEYENGGDEKEEEEERKAVESVSVSRPRHRQCSSVDGVAGDGLGVFCAEIGEVKKAMAADKLANLAAIDPKRAKRILANRQSAARSKERKARYILELERKVQTLQTEATTLSAQLTLYQRDTTGLSTENAELKLHLQAMEQQAQLHDALNDALKQEVERLKVATGEASNHSESFNLNLHHMSFSSPFFSPQQSGGHQQGMQLSQQLSHSQLNMANQQLIPHSSALSDIIQNDSLGRLQGLDINRESLHIIKSENSISASESSSTF